ncbi:MAG: zinc ABC transporter substrate-binding protein [Alphaproteobacteria bacterium]|nr:zinc ABC transporter substrate-binding protein [Alphaproteobacteria bacterium]
MNRVIGAAAALAVALVSAAAPLAAADPPLRVFACEPEWGALASALGGDRVDVFVATTALQDPHAIQARPALVARLRRADLAVCTGAELEVGWLPVLQRQANNPDVNPGRLGFFEATDFVGALLEKPERLDRADGDVHAAGNPHIQTDPRRLRLVAVALAQRLAVLDGAHAAAHEARARRFLADLDAAMARWEAAAAPLRGVPVAVAHKNWAYLLDWLGLKEVAAVEPRPGIPPGSGHLAQLLVDLPRQRARAILVAAYEDPRAAAFVAQRTGIPLVTLPFTVGGSPGATDVIGLFDETVRLLLAAVKDAG